MSSTFAKGILISVCILSAQTLEAQQSLPPIETMLGDASCVLNRYEELAAGVVCDAWKVPDSLKQTCRDDLKATLATVESVKPALSRAAKAQNADLVDLFDIYAAPEFVSSDLNWLARNQSQFANDSDDGMTYARAGARAVAVASRLGVEVRMRLLAQESQLSHCVAQH